MNFADQLVKQIERKNSRVCVGLDPAPEKLPAEYGRAKTASAAQTAQSVFDFNKRIIESVKEHCVVVKPNLAFYLALGDAGWGVLKKTVACAKSEGLLAVVDCKANDIGNTAEAYARAFYGDLNADAITLNPLLGSDSLEPFFKYCGEDRGVFVLAKTSNPSSAEFQDLKTNGKENLSDRIASKIAAWEEYGLGEEGYSSVGAVVGAASPAEAARLRKKMKKQFFLVPGYGAQGGSAAQVKNCFNPDGLGAVVSSSRGVIYASNGKDFAEAASEAAEKMKLEINSAIGL